MPRVAIKTVDRRLRREISVPSGRSVAPFKSLTNRWDDETADKKAGQRARPRGSLLYTCASHHLRLRLVRRKKGTEGTAPRDRSPRRTINLRRGHSRASRPGMSAAEPKVSTFPRLFGIPIELGPRSLPIGLPAIVASEATRLRPILLSRGAVQRRLDRTRYNSRDSGPVIGYLRNVTR